jgi:hypothetical protein
MTIIDIAHEMIRMHTIVMVMAFTVIAATGVVLSMWWARVRIIRSGPGSVALLMLMGASAIMGIWALASMPIAASYRQVVKSHDSDPSAFAHAVSSATMTAHHQGSTVMMHVPGVVQDRLPMTWEQAMDIRLTTPTIPIAITHP